MCGAFDTPQLCCGVVHWQKSLTIFSSHTYFEIQSICKFCLILVIIVDLFSKSNNKSRNLFRSFIVSLFILMIYSISVSLYIESISYEHELHYKQILKYLDEQDPINYQTEELENNINIIDRYSSKTIKFKIRF